MVLEDVFTVQECSWAVNSCLLPNSYDFGVQISYMQVLKPYLSTRSDLEGFWGFKTLFRGVHGFGRVLKP